MNGSRNYLPCVRNKRSDYPQEATNTRVIYEYCLYDYKPKPRRAKWRKKWCFSNLISIPGCKLLWKLVDRFWIISSETMDNFLYKTRYCGHIFMPVAATDTGESDTVNKIGDCFLVNPLGYFFKVLLCTRLLSLKCKNVITKLTCQLSISS